MAGQNQIEQYNQETLFNKYNKELMNQVALWYIKDKFAVQTDYDEYKALESYMFKELYETEDCEVKKFLKKKFRGALDKNIKIIDLKSLQTEFRDINNYFFSAANYEIVEF